MFVLGNFIIACANIIHMIMVVLYWLILIRALISWVSPDPFNPIVRFLYSVTEPILMPIRRLIPPSGIDFSPIIAFLAIYFIDLFLVQSLIDLGYRLR